jgi:CHAT domain-containing protein
MTQFQIGWAPGSSAVFEMSIPSGKGSGGVKMTFVPPLRGTLRLPVNQPGFTIEDLESPANKVRKIFSLTPNTPRNSIALASIAPAEPLPTIEELGLELWQTALPQQVESELGGRGLFLEIGTDEKLQDYPWELMHDGDEFYCLKHYIGRFLNAAERIAPPSQSIGDKTSVLGPFAPLRVLVICVDNPPPFKDVILPKLPGAYVEMQSVSTTLALIRGVQVQQLAEGAGTHDAVRSALSSGEYQIVHFIGHTHVDPADPRGSGLVLQDRLMTAKNVLQFLTKKARPVLCFINGCEASRSLDAQASSGTFGLARAILESGSYLLGSRWKVSDAPASQFGQAFYAALLADGKPIGQAVTEARLKCRTKSPDDPAWASYAYYGDPRVCFRGF